MSMRKKDKTEKYAGVEKREREREREEYKERKRKIELSGEKE